MSGFRKQTDAWRQAWESEAIGKPYGDLFFDRATGKLPEMESSKAAAARITALAKSEDCSMSDVAPDIIIAASDRAAQQHCATPDSMPRPIT